MTNPDFYSLFAYGIALLLTMFWASKYERTHREAFFYISFVTTLLFCGCRFFVGNDYWGYYNIFCNIQNFPESAFLFIEPGYALLNLLLSSCPIGYFFVLFICSTLTFSLVFYLLAKYNILKWGVFAIYTLGFLIIANDQVRQLVAIPIFFYSIKYIDEGKLFKYMLCILLAMTFHYSAAICIILYLLKFIRFNKKYILILLCFAFILKLSGIAETLMHNVSNYLSFFNESYAEKAFNDRYYSGATFGVQLLYYFIISIIILITIPTSQYDNTIIKVFSIGACLYILFWGQMLFERMSLYMFETIIFAFPLAMRRNKIMIKGAAIVCLTYFTLQSLYALEKNGAVPYRTFINENLENPKYDKNTQAQ